MVSAFTLHTLLLFPCTTLPSIHCTGHTMSIRDRSPGDRQPIILDDREDLDAGIEDERLKSAADKEQFDIQLQAARAHTPRFLFRGWNNKKDKKYGYSGGYKDLNTSRAITPLAYYEGRRPTPIFEQGQEPLRQMLSDHLTGVQTEPDDSNATQFSSWASSLAVVFRFARGKYSHVSIIDTHALPRNNVIAYVPKLAFMDPAFKRYHWEYHAHGVISGPAYRVVPVKAFKRIGFPNDSKWGARPLIPEYPESEDQNLRAPPPTVTQSDLSAAKKVARRYGERFVIPVILGICMSKLRCRCSGCLDFPQMMESLDAVILYLYKKYAPVPHDWSADPAIMEDMVCTAKYQDVQAMIFALRTLVRLCYGPEARMVEKQVRAGEWSKKMFRLIEEVPEPQCEPQSESCPEPKEEPWPESETQPNAELPPHPQPGPEPEPWLESEPCAESEPCSEPEAWPELEPCECRW